MSGDPKPPDVRWAVGIALLASALFCVWTVHTSRAALEFRGPKRDYYNLLVQGFRKGHLYMDADPDPSLLALAPAERPGNAPFLLDASLYRGHYYLYFGVVPAALIYLPYAVLTGQGFPEAWAALIFAFAGLFFSTLWWLDAKSRFFPRSGTLWAVVSILGIAMGSAVPSTLRRPLFYEVAIAAGYAFMMLALWSFTRARLSTGRRSGWLVLGAVAAGLAVGSRANLAPACVALVVCGAYAAGAGRGRGAGASFLAAGLAFGAVIAALGAYNAARFGNPFEFGHAYQLGVEPNRLFHLANLEHNTGIYYLRPPALNGYFPFVAPSAEPVKPPDYVGRESAHGEWVWLPLAAAALCAWIWLSSGRARARPRDAIGVVGLPVLMFAVNFIVTASAGVRANRYMLDFHPMLVLAVVAMLGMALEGTGWPARAGALAAGAGIIVAAAFNMLGSMQAQGFFRLIDPIAYSAVAGPADRMAWPFLGPGAAAVGDRVVKLRWPLAPRPLAMEPVGAAGTPGNDDVLWVQYAAGRARFIYQYWEYGQAFGRWFAFEPGKLSELRISGAFLLPPPGHPWYGDRPPAQQEILKRSLTLSLDGVPRFERDVPSHDSSPGLQSWGAWRHADGVEHAFSGAILGVGNEAVNDVPARRAIAGVGTVRMRLEFPQDCIGRYEPLLQSGSPSAFDTLIVRYVRPGFVQLVHDQLGSGATSSPEFAVDYSGVQHVEVDLPYADDRVDWLENEPAFRVARTERLRVAWNGRVVFESDVPPVRAQRSAISLGANLFRSSVAQTLFAGILEPEPPRRTLGAVGEGSLAFRPGSPRAFEDARGTLVRFDRDDGETAALAWRRSGSGGGASLGWTEKGATTWCSRPVGVENAAAVAISISKDGEAIGDAPTRTYLDSRGRFVVEVGATTVLAQRTGFFAAGAVNAVGSGAGEWSGRALLDASVQGPPGPGADASPSILPGRIRFTFLAGRQGRISSSPVLTAGRAGAADCVYLRSVPGGRFVVGLDHWSVGVTESDPFELAAAEIHAIGIEMSSLDPARSIPEGALRISVDGRVVLDCRTALYPVRPGEVLFGRNPLGMTTSARAFEGDFISVRTHLAAADLVPGNP